MAPKEAATVLVGDWQADRACQMTAALCTSFQVCTADGADTVVALARRHHPAVAILPLRWSREEAASSVEHCTGFAVLREIEDLETRPNVILFDHQLARLSLREYCSPFLRGVVAFLDEDDPTFTSAVRTKVHGFLQQRPTADDATTAYLEALGLVGRSPALRTVREFVQKAGQLSDVPVLITGESGTGKELIARAIHHLDRKRSQGPFIAVNCGAVPDLLAESEFFGHTRGAFTGAVAARPGYFRAAHRGVLFLDEISELDLTLQPKLLRVLQESRILPVGEETERDVDVRVIAGTNKELAAQVVKGEFRLDLYHRLNVLSVRMPELKQRKEDIGPLIHFLLKKHQACYDGTVARVEPRVLDLLTSFELEGNVRELENIVRQALFRKQAGDALEMGDLPPEVIERVFAGPRADRERDLARLLLDLVHEGNSLEQATAYCERVLIEVALTESGGNRTRTASLLKTSPRTLYNKLRRDRLT